MKGDGIGQRVGRWRYESTRSLVVSLCHQFGLNCQSGRADGSGTPEIDERNSATNRELLREVHTTSCNIVLLPVEIYYMLASYCRDEILFMAIFHAHFPSTVD